MTWLYRVFHEQDGYCVRVVLYASDGTIIGYHREPASPSGRTAEELAQDIEWFRHAFELPILTIEEVEAVLAQKPLEAKPMQVGRKTLEELEAELTLDDNDMREPADFVEVSAAR